jgi:FKBP-type peptidyl-prolyl cis-trans isomerase
VSRWSRLSRHLPIRPTRSKGVPTLVLETVAAGDGPLPLPGQSVTVEVMAALEGSRDAPIPDLSGTRSFILGEGRVIRAVEEGAARTRTGGVCRLRAPAGLAYGHEGVPGVVPPGATLMIELRVVSVASTPPPG